MPPVWVNTVAGVGCVKIDSRTRAMVPANLKSPPRVSANAERSAKPAGSRESGSGSPSARPVALPAIVSADMAGNIVACNEATLKLFERSRGEVLGRSLAALARGGDGPEERQLQTALLAALKEHGNYSCSPRCQIGSGKQLTTELSVTLLRDAGAAPAGMIALISPVQAPRHTPEQDAEAETAAYTVSRDLEGAQLILASPLMHRFMRMVDRVAAHNESVLVTGETGTGKELIARTIHQASHRRSRPWVDINCAALPENLVESELFGYEKGAFTGADSSRAGLFELADRGTLFLDEIGELQPQTQVKLLRVLDGYPFYRLGGHRKIKVDVRIVAATNQDLDAAVSSGRFRQDLFHRLGQFQLRVPPLRERPEDVVALAEHFLALKNPGSSFAPDAISALLSHPWPGNVRELRNLIARVAVESRHPEIQKAGILAGMSGNPASMRHTASIPVGNLDSMEEQMIIRALERSGGHRSQAAEQLGISRRTLSRKLREYNIQLKSGEPRNTLGLISPEQQKFFRARVHLAVTLKNQEGEEVTVEGVNLSIGGMGLDGLTESARFRGLLDVSFPLPESETIFQAKARIVWFGGEGRVGIRFAVIDPTLFEHLQYWVNQKMKDEGWESPA